MRYPYQLKDIALVQIREDEDGATHTTFDLPAPKNWRFRHYSYEHNQTVIRSHVVTRIRVCISQDEVTRQPVAVVVPSDEEGRENHGFSGTVIMHGAASIVAVLSRLGFEPILPLN